MKYDEFHEELPDSLVRGAVGFVGVIATIFLLPRIVRFAVRNYLFRAVAEIIGIVTLGLLTEKFTQWVSRVEPLETQESTEPARTVEEAVA